MHGWAGQILRIDLTHGEVHKEPLNETWATDYIGGRGLAARYLWELMPDRTVDPFSPENVLIFATGPLTGTNTSCGSRYMVVTKGALTNAITTSNSGGFWGPELKFAGYDFVILQGQAPRPQYLWIYDDTVELRDASGVWGKGTFESEDRIREEVGVADAHVAGIGPAGENRVRFACIINDKHRAAGRSGVGAVMGSKNLKAIAVRGTGGVSVANPAAYMKAVWTQHGKMSNSEDRKGMSALGTAPTMDMTNQFGALPTRNFKEGTFEGTENLNGNAIRNGESWIRNKACFACTIACGRVTRPSDSAGRFMVNTHPRNWKIAGEGPEYENAWSLGADCGIQDLDAVLMANLLCNDLGMDPISMGATVASAMELYEKGVLTDEVTGTPMPFGSGEALVRMTEATGYREGFGDELAEGSARMGVKFEHPEVFMGVKGQEFPAYDPRGFQGMGVAYATCNRGACHLRAWTPALETQEGQDAHSPVGKSSWVIDQQNQSTAHDNTGICLFTGFAGSILEDLSELTVAATGVEYSHEEFVKAGERTWNLERVWNLESGLTAADDDLPERLLKESHTKGMSKGVTVQLDQMLPEYYSGRGWDTEGRPKQEKLSELELAEFLV